MARLEWMVHIDRKTERESQKPAWGPEWPQLARSQRHEWFTLTVGSGQKGKAKSLHGDQGQQLTWAGRAKYRVAADRPVVGNRVHGFSTTSVHTHRHSIDRKHTKNTWKRLNFEIAANC